jgi:uncharacterized membrane protein YidH (DUF202 family)
VSSFPERGALQPERTALSWQRTTLTALVVLVPLVVVSLRVGDLVVAAGGGCAIILAGVIVGRVWRRLTQLADDTRGYSPFIPMVMVAAVTILGALGGVAVSLSLVLRGPA